MRVAYLDCASGISGDMLLGALVDAGADLRAIQEGLDSLGLAGLRLVRREVERRGERATKISVECPPERGHRHLEDIAALIGGSAIPRPARELALRVFDELARAEAKVHRTSVDRVHFHEVGAADSIADIVGCAIAWGLLGAERALASPVPTGRGFVWIHGRRCPLPAPATAELLRARSVPLAPSAVEAELTTPTGAALLAVLADAFGPPPSMQIAAAGAGAGDRDLAEQPNVLRLRMGTVFSS